VEGGGEENRIEQGRRWERRGGSGKMTGGERGKEGISE
jgi:hypothetical protein